MSVSIGRFVVFLTLFSVVVVVSASPTGSAKQVEGNAAIFNFELKLLSFFHFQREVTNNAPGFKYQNNFSLLQVCAALVQQIFLIYLFII